MVIWICIIVFCIGLIILNSFFMNKDLKKAMNDNSINPDYINRHRTFAIESSTKRIMIFTNGKFKVYAPEDVLSWQSFSRGIDNVIEFHVKDLDNPNPTVSFQSRYGERDAWFARISALYG